ncbi:cell wall-binding repeat-containing protein [Leifsonia poae]|uniref:cell wall-binding repeat-containing protein n=1 Tax=Leifsonia poae TaxID=110933 RepID=UPI001CBAA7E4|nr:cell wall-binding repeat-containing protein [Leifsonia poae]
MLRSVSPRRSLLAVFCTLAIVAGGLAATEERAEAITVGQLAAFDAGYIISDNNFYNAQAADQATVQAFLNSKVSTCSAGYVCLKSYTQTTPSRAADAMCGAYAGAANELASQIITKVGRACGISQKVLLVLLQKEQSLVTDTSPSASQYRIATGYACPDTSACDSQYYGFANQVYQAAWQFKRYGNPPGTSNYFSWLPVGSPSAIRYHPNAACGTKTVTIRNKATAALYYYTPYTPNASALAHPYGTGDSCSSYGNRNFFSFYTDWFGSPVSTSPPFGAYDSVAFSGGKVTVSGWAIDPAAAATSISVRVDVTDPAGTRISQTVLANGNRPDVGAVYTVIGAGPAHGFSVSTPITGAGGQFSACITMIGTSFNSVGSASLGCRTFFSSVAGGTPSTSRISGADRYSTAALLSKSAYPTAGVPVVYIATGTTFTDAMSAAPAAAAQSGPILLVAAGSVPDPTLTELKRLAPKRIVVIGGTTVIPPAVYNTLAGLTPSISRIGGATRWETSSRIMNSAFPGATSLYLATGTAFPDALSASAAAGAAGRPVLLVDGGASSIDSATRALFAKNKVTSVTIVGGPVAVSAGIAASIGTTGAAVTRIAGADRFTTSNAINQASFTTADSVYLATGVTFPDALAGAAIAGAKKVPLLITPSACLPRFLGQNIAKFGAKSVVVIGGEVALAPAVKALTPC